MEKANFKKNYKLVAFTLKGHKTWRVSGFPLHGVKESEITKKKVIEIDCMTGEVKVI